MQIIIPMSGYGERFRRAGFDVPKPLIMVDGKPIIAHVIDLFPGETDFVFICNREHLAEPAYAMAETLRHYCPTGRIVAIDPHRHGPVWAVLQARPHIDLTGPVFINYCDFSCVWDWTDFKAFVTETACAGAVPAYRGFHPHSLHGNAYAFIRQSGLWLTDIQEKQPFTDTPIDEFASSGGYYFDSGARAVEMLEAVVDQQLTVNAEFYVSLAFKVMAQRALPVAVYELQHFMQWGTPDDLAEYLGWSRAFRRLAFDEARRARQSGAVLLPMAGYGKRFADAGYTLTKPLIPVSGRPMVIQATRDLPDAPITRFVVRRDVSMLDALLQKLRTSFIGTSVLVLDEGTEGQAITCLLGVDGLDEAAPLTIGACDNAMLYDVGKFEAAMRPGGADMLVWIVRGHADGRLRPTNFGWVSETPDGRVDGVLVKAAPADPATAAMIVGAFSFRRAGDFKTAAAALVARDGRINGEFYVDSLVTDALAAGLDVRTFEIDHYLGWGTPNDLKTFEYWQSAFAKWPSHPYRLDRDRRIPAHSVAALEARTASRPAPRPETGAQTAAGAAPQPGPLAWLRAQFRGRAL